MFVHLRVKSSEKIENSSDCPCYSGPVCHIQKLKTSLINSFACANKYFLSELGRKRSINATYVHQNTRYSSMVELVIFRDKIAREM